MHSQTLQFPCVSLTHSQHLYPLPNPPTPLHLVNAIPTPIPSPDPMLIQPFLFFCVKSIPDNPLVSQLWSGKAQSCIILPCSMHPSLSFLALYISVLFPVCCTFSIPHCLLPVMTMPVPTPIGPILTCLYYSRVFRIIPEHPFPILNLLTLS